MKKTLITLFIFLTTIFSWGQTNTALKFLGIPIEGSEIAFTEKLKTKGFRYDSYTEGYKGQFNGQIVTVYVHTNHQLVDRVYVSFPTTRSESDTRTDFNTLLRQFNKSGKYIDLSFNEEIPSTEDISYEITCNNKRYQASFCYFDPDQDQALFIDKLCDELSNSFSGEQVALMRASLNESLKQSSGDQNSSIDDALQDFFDKLSSNPDEMILYISKILDAWKNIADGDVWFMIHEHYGQYNIGLYYDNLHNKANGEDL